MANCCCGIAWCGRCGYKMYVRYKGGGEYACNHLHSHSGLPDCQRVRAAQIDAAVADAFLAALAPGEFDALRRGLGRHNSKSTRPCALALNGA
ncbi:recombinase zinc beta ribbon domain-containing protein [Sinorhizobium meliloti]|uniref:recombinase zinc beta ribbon domain-containing protein n=1 Tax=Rhizobium meliloti TaxID=382 RepID=UPI00398C9434